MKNNVIPRKAKKIEVTFVRDTAGNKAGGKTIVEKNEFGEWSDGRYAYLVSMLRNPAICTLKILECNEAESKDKTCFGFGVEPSETQNHFFVVIPNSKEKKTYVEIYERYKWTTKPLDENDVLRLRISKEKWNAVVKDMTAEFNSRLRAEHKPVGKFTSDGTPIERMFGKEMMTLLWAIQDCDQSNIYAALSNWKGLKPEERWWLYTMTNASTGGIDDNNSGWRVALRYALCENPISEKKN